MFIILQENPEISVLVISITFTAIGFISKTLIDAFLEKKRNEKGIKKLFWTEKLNAAKKAYEFYCNHLELLELNIRKIDIELKQDGCSPLLDLINKTICELSEQTIENKSFEHHHIRMFYDLDTKPLNNLNAESLVIIQRIEKIKPTGTGSLEETKGLRYNLREKYEEQKRIYEKYLKDIREDISKFTKQNISTIKMF